MYEIRALLKYDHYSHKDDWEMSRLIAYVIAQVNSKKKLKFQDIAKFYWEDEEQDEHDTSISKEDIERLKKRAEAYIKQIKQEEKCQK